ncbi:Hypothetical predicted protein [Lynx pardinus]|uniref:Uncharacterized protein n=1 Tax=Lynx pardinus TaxID=191816 RepID=A0A485MPW2_LYNPA|nr:Hypothetical predicted protein [Lynx pardinus]
MDRPLEIRNQVQGSEESWSVRRLHRGSLLAALSAKSVCALSLSPNKDCGAAANDVVSKLKRGHHSDGSWLPENPAGRNPA